MKLLTDLSGVKPDEIQHMDGDEVVAIYGRTDEQQPWLVVLKSADGNHNGYLYGQDELYEFAYKSSAKRVLKPLHQILDEHTYYIGTSGTIYFNCCPDEIPTSKLHIFNGSNTEDTWPESFYTEIIDDGDK